MWLTSTSDRIRDEVPGDEARIADVTTRAFTGAEHSDGTEVQIVERLRGDGDLTLSLVAEASGAIIGHVAFSPVTIGGVRCGWFGLGPVSVVPERQGEGVGGALIARGLDRLRAPGASGCVVLGDPRYYRRFGFSHDPSLTYRGPPPEYFQYLTFVADQVMGEVAYAPAFGG